MITSEKSQAVVESTSGETEVADGEATAAEHPDSPTISVKLRFGRVESELKVRAGVDVAEFRNRVFELTQVPPTMQKLVHCSKRLTDGHTLVELGVGDGAKVMVIGSTVQQVMQASSKPNPAELHSEEKPQKKEPLCQQKIHLKMIEKGVPDDAMPGIKGAHEALPPAPIKGMRNKSGRSVRLTFKMELDQVWVGTPERTEKLPMNSINDVVAEPIVGHEEYHLMGIKVGSTEQSRIWLYWVPSQYVAAIKRAIE